MKIDIGGNPPADIFKNRRKLTIIFIVLVVVGFLGLLLGAYAILFDTAYYDQLEKISLIFFVSPAVFVSFVGEKLQAYKELTPSQQKELAGLCQKYPEIRNYCDKLTNISRRLIRAEFEACQAWAEEAVRKSVQQKE